MIQHIVSLHCDSFYTQVGHTHIHKSTPNRHDHETCHVISVDTDLIKRHTDFGSAAGQTDV